MLLCSINLKTFDMKSSDKNSKKPQPNKSLANFENQAIDADKIKGGVDFIGGRRLPKPTP